jgi:putative transposase
LANGRRFRALTVIDLFTRECLVIDVGHGLCGRDVVATLERLRFERGLPQRIYCDNGTEFVSAAMDLWAYTNTVILDFSRRGKPTDNAAIESFNGRFREECLNVHWFQSLEDAQQKIDAFRWDYNEHHPHRALKGLSPNEYAPSLTGMPASTIRSGRCASVPDIGNRPAQGRNAKTLANYETSGSCWLQRPHLVYGGTGSLRIGPSARR